MPSLWDPSFLKWFYPGMRIKRWLILLLLGVTILGLGFGYFLREVYLSYTFPSSVYYITLQFLPRFVRGALFTGISLGFILFAVWRLNQSLLSALMPSRQENMVEIIYGQRLLRRGVKVVA
ncbi:MAG TPA: hypothetical protein VJM69_05175, partial [Dehalococcoidia bacterium]|nr:hypothetical protein [Dehalococcoidia bacterium]